MGMFDWVKSSYPLPEPFMGINQTKDIEDGIGGTMTDYWLDPAGHLWQPTYVDTHNICEITEDDPRYEPEKRFLNFEWIPTGQHGKYHVHPITKYIEIYPAEWQGKYEDWPRLRLHFRYGKLQDYEDVTGR